jgi:hypothetical protein
MINKWNKLPYAKQQQIARAYNIKWYGVTSEQLEDELENKLPLDLRKELADDTKKNKVIPKEDEIKPEEEDAEPQLTTETEKPRLSCPKCGKEYGRQGNLDNHIKVCTQE